jgi:hypothetical protein
MSTEKGSASGNHFPCTSLAEELPHLRWRPAPEAAVITHPREWWRYAAARQRLVGAPYGTTLG